MAKRAIIKVISDLSGDEGAQTYQIPLPVNPREIDLTPTEAKGLEAALAALEPFLKASARTGHGRIVGDAPKAATTKTKLQPWEKEAERNRRDQIRAWAHRNNHKVSDRGSIKKEIVEAYDAAMAAKAADEAKAEGAATLAQVAEDYKGEPVAELAAEILADKAPTVPVVERDKVMVAQTGGRPAREAEVHDWAHGGQKVKIQYLDAKNPTWVARAKVYTPGAATPPAVLAPAFQAPQQPASTPEEGEDATVVKLDSRRGNGADAAAKTTRTRATKSTKGKAATA